MIVPTDAITANGTFNVARNNPTAGNLRIETPTKAKQSILSDQGSTTSFPPAVFSSIIR
jgi:hypothetical protein